MMMMAVMYEVWEQRQHTPITETLKRWGIEKQEKKVILEESGRGKEVGRCRKREIGSVGVPGRGGNRGFIRGTRSKTGMTTMLLYDDALVQLTLIILLDPVLILLDPVQRATHVGDPNILLKVFCFSFCEIINFIFILQGLNFCFVFILKDFNFHSHLVIF